MMTILNLQQQRGAAVVLGINAPIQIKPQSDFSFFNGETKAMIKKFSQCFVLIYEADVNTINPYYSDAAVNKSKKQILIGTINELMIFSHRLLTVQRVVLLVL